MIESAFYILLAAALIVGILLYVHRKCHKVSHDMSHALHTGVRRDEPIHNSICRPFIDSEGNVSHIRIRR